MKYVFLSLTCAYVSYTYKGAFSNASVFNVRYY